MLRMPTQHRTKYDKGLNIRTTEAGRRAVKIIVNRLEAWWLKNERPGQPPTAQEVVNASWLYLSSWSEDHLAGDLIGYVDLLRARNAQSVDTQNPGGFDGGLPPGVTLVATGGEDERETAPRGERVVDDGIAPDTRKPRAKGRTKR